MISSNDDLVKYLVRTGALKTERILKSFSLVNRSDFVPSSLQSDAFTDQALPIGWGQTISQPSTIAFMLELLQPGGGDKVLEIGSGSGYVAALLSQIVGGAGLVIAIERLEELVKVASTSLAKYYFKQLNMLAADGSEGYEQSAPYNKIIISAAASKMPKKIISQLANRGRMVFPYGEGIQEIILLAKVNNEIIEHSYPGFVFVPLIE